jgi:polyferredoxin
MDWMTMLYLISSLFIVAAISFWVRKSMLRPNGRHLLSVQLAVLGFGLISSGTALQFPHLPVSPPPLLDRLLEPLGFVFVVAGVAVLFILFCISRGLAPNIDKPSADRENSMGEYLR